MRKKIIALSEDQYRLLKEGAERNKRSMNAEVDMAIDAWVGIRPAVFSGDSEKAEPRSCDELSTSEKVLVGAVNGVGSMAREPEGKVYPGYNGMNPEAKKFLDGHRTKVTGEGIEESEVSKAIKEFGIDKVLGISREDNELEYNELNSAARINLRNDLKFCSSRADVEKVAKKFKLFK